MRDARFVSADETGCSKTDAGLNTPFGRQFLILNHANNTEGAITSRDIRTQPVLFRQVCAVSFANVREVVSCGAENPSPRDDSTATAIDG
jgi:hypothetical protein